MSQVRNVKDEISNQEKRQESLDTYLDSQLWSHELEYFSLSRKRYFDFDLIERHIGIQPHPKFVSAIKELLTWKSDQPITKFDTYKIEMRDLEKQRQQMIKKAAMISRKQQKLASISNKNEKKKNKYIL